MPWIYPVGVKIDDGPPTPLMTAAELAQTLGMLRGKRIHEAIMFSSNRYDTPAAAAAWQKTQRLIGDAYASRIVSVIQTSQDGSSGITDTEVLAKLNETLLDSSHQPRTFSVSSATSGPCDRWATLRVDFEDNAPSTPPQPGLQRLVTDAAHPRDFLINVECQAFDLSNNPKTNVNYKLSCRRTDGVYVTLSSFDGDTTISSGRNSQAETRCYWYAPNSAQDPATARIDPSSIQIHMTSEDCQPYTVKFDLVQVIPYAHEAARIDGPNCVPPVTLGASAPPTPVDGAVFRDDGFLVFWNHPLTLESRPCESNHYVRVYRVTGDSDHPLVDITCLTHQEVFTTLDPPLLNYGIRIWYKPSETGATKRLPDGAYLFRTFDRGEAEYGSACAESHYMRLRTRVGPFDLDPYVTPEQFMMQVSGMTYGTPVCPMQCPHENRLCIADTDDGNGTGTPDGGVTIDDLLYYLFIFEDGLICADVDNGTGLGCPEGGITIEDLLYYLFRFESGC